MKKLHWRELIENPSYLATSQTELDTFLLAIKDYGLHITYPARDTLLLDLDTTEALSQLDDKLEAIRNLLEIDFPLIKTYPSMSGLPKMHSIIRMSKELTAAERIILQMFLGSDPYREFYSLTRLRFGIEPFSILIDEEEP